MSDVEQSAGSATTAEAAPQSQASSAPQESGGAPTNGGAEAPTTVQPKSIQEKLAAIHDGIKAGAKAGVSGAAASGAPPKADPATSVQGAGAAPGTPPGAKVDQPNAPVAGAEAAAAAVAAYQANLKFKFRGKEHEIPQFLHSIVKDEASEKQVRDLVEKSMGLDFVKPQFQELQQTHGALTKGLEALDKYVARDPQTGLMKDPGKFLSQFGFTDSDIFHYAKSRLEYSQLPDDQRALIDQQQSQTEQLEQLQEQNAILQQQQEVQQATERAGQLQQLMSHPQVAPVVAQYFGGAKAFYRDVALYASVVQMQTGQDLQPGEAVAAFMQDRGLGAQPPQAATAAPSAPTPPASAAAPQVPPAAAPAAPVTTQGQAPTLPKVPGQGTSPARKMVANMKDLNARKAQLLAEQGE